MNQASQFLVTGDIKWSDIFQMQAKKEWSLLLCVLHSKWVPEEDNFGEIFPDKKQAPHALILH